MEEKKRKTDRRTLYTRKVIMDAYIQLIKEKPRDRIKVTELCQRAEINRCTFYLHFQDISEIEISIRDELLSRFESFVETQKPTSINRKKVSDKFLEKLMEDDTYVTLMKATDQMNLLAGFVAPYFHVLKDTLPPGSSLSEREQELLYSFLVGGILSVQRNWILNQSNVRKENHILDRMVQILLTEMGKSKDY